MIEQDRIELNRIKQIEQDLMESNRKEQDQIR